MKLIAFYLPQFHEIEENNKWWGKGFTEWSNTRKAKPLFWGHNQPRVPYKGYYDLSDSSIMKEQMKLAKKYGMGGFCFYHYWFNGKKLLERPIEKLLEEKRIELPFCLSWANEPWTRTWDGEKGAKEILMEQNYGDEKDWKKHFDYLLNYFIRDEYIKVDGKPVFLIYKAQQIPRCDDMITLWNKLANENGMKGIYFIYTSANGKICNIDGFNAEVDFEPFRTVTGTENLKHKISKNHLLKKFKFLKSKKLYPIINYIDVYEAMICRKGKRNIKTYFGAFVDWDNTARRGKDPLLIIDNANPKNFEYYLEKQVLKSMSLKNELLFINAWNEWGEGTYLEPDKKYGYAYLRAIKRVMDKIFVK